MTTTANEIKDACRVARQNANGACQIEEAWTIKAVRGGSAWLYYLVSAIGEQWGGHNRTDSFSEWASDFIWKAGY